MSATTMEVATTSETVDPPSVTRAGQAAPLVSTPISVHVRRPARRWHHQQLIPPDPGVFIPWNRRWPPTRLRNQDGHLTIKTRFMCLVARTRSFGSLTPHQRQCADI